MMLNMQMALWQGSSEFSRELWFGEVIGRAGPWMEGVDGQSTKSNILLAVTFVDAYRPI